MGYLWAKYEGNNFLDYVPPATRSLKKGALKTVSWVVGKAAGDVKGMYLSQWNAFN